MVSNALEILHYLRDNLEAPLTLAVPAMRVTLDEPLTLVYSDLPSCSIYPVREDFVPDESSNSSDKQHLALRVELRMPGAPASTVCTPVLNVITQALKSDLRLGGLADYVEAQTIQWASETVAEGPVCAASLDILVAYS